MIADRWEEDDINFPEKKIHYYYHTSGKPTIIFLHGIMDNGLCWSRVADVLKDDFDVYLLDARGHGKTSDPSREENFNIEKFIKDIDDFLMTKELEDVIIIGHSMGGAEAAGMAAWYSKKVKAIILEDPGFSDSKFVGFFLKILITIYALKRPKIPPKSFEKYLKRAKKFNKNWNEEDLEVWALAQQELSTHKFSNFLRGIKKMPKWQEQFVKIKCPILLITSEKGLIKQSKADLMKELNPNVLHKNIMEAGHNIRRQQFQEFIGHVKNFLVNLGAI